MAFPSELLAIDLVDIFRSARTKDPAWEAQKLAFESQKEVLSSSEALLFPKIAITGSIRGIETSGSGAAIINPVYLEGSALTACLRQGLDNCNPPLIIRDDVGGRYDTYQTTLQFTQPLYNYGLWRNYNKSKVLEDKVNSDLESAKQDLIIRVATAYFAVLKAYEEWEQNKAEIDSAERRLEQTKEGFALGLFSQNDVFDVVAARDSSQVSLLIAQTELENTQENLMLMTQRRDVSLATLSDNILIETPRPSTADAWVEKGLAHNRNLLAAHSSVLAAEQELAIKRGNFHPEIDLVAGQSISRNDEVAFESSPSVKTTGIGLNFRYFLYKGGLTTSELKAAKLELERSNQIFELARRDVIRNVRNSFRKVNNDVKGVEAAEQAVLSRGKSLESTREGYFNGSRTLLSVLSAESDLFSAKKDYANARYNYILDSLNLKYEAGTLTVEDLQIINSWLDTDKLIAPTDAEEESLGY